MSSSFAHGPLGLQSANKLKVLPITPVPALLTRIPAVEIDPSDLFTKGGHPPVQLPGALPGSLFGTIHGFTQRGCTGVIVPVMVLPASSELEELYSPAVAVAL